MTKHSGGRAINGGSAPEPDRGRLGEVAGNGRVKGQDPSPGDRERGETSDADGCTAHDRAA